VPELAPVMHQRVLRALDDARQDVRATAKASKPKTGYMGFELAENHLVNCRAAVEKLTDRNTVITMLARLDGLMALTGGGDVAPAVKRTHEALAQLFKALEQD
jgi:hypothetical protein